MRGFTVKLSILHSFSRLALAEAEQPSEMGMFNSLTRDKRKLKFDFALPKSFLHQDFGADRRPSFKDLLVETHSGALIHSKVSENLSNKTERFRTARWVLQGVVRQEQLWDFC